MQKLLDHHWCVYARFCLSFACLSANYSTEDITAMFLGAVSRFRTGDMWCSSDMVTTALQGTHCSIQPAAASAACPYLWQSHKQLYDLLIDISKNIFTEQSVLSIASAACCEQNDLSGCGFHSLKCLVNVDLIIFMCG